MEDEDKRTTAATSATTALTAKGKALSSSSSSSSSSPGSFMTPGKRGGGRVTGCRVLVWALVCVAVLVVSFLLAVLVWTVATYQHTLLSLQQRVDRLEAENQHFNQHIDVIVQQTVDKYLQQVNTKQNQYYMFGLPVSLIQINKYK
jgi:Flp pilus assembly protein TadB